MVDLNQILAKTSTKANSISPETKRVLNIATDDRPYHAADTSKSVNQSSFPENEKGTKREQLEVKKGTKREQLEVKKGTKKNPKREQNIPDSTPEPSLDKLQRLTGHQKKIMHFLLERTIDRGELHTGPVTYDDLCCICNTSHETIKVQIKRLVKKALINRLPGKRARGGYMLFMFSPEIKASLISLKKQTLTCLQTDYKGNKKGSAKESHTEVVVSSSYINTTTNMNKDFQHIDTSPLSDIGFSQSHIIQVHREYEKNPDLALPADIVQESINALAFDLKHNNVAQDFKKSPAVVLTALLKKGKPYSSKTPEKYMTPAEEAMRDYLAAKEIRHKNKLAVESKIKEIEYQEWLSGLPAEELMELVPESEVADVPEKLRKTLRRRKALELSKEYFEAEIWPSKHQALLAEVVEPA